MKRIAIPVLFLALAAGCGKGGDVGVFFFGSTPITEAQKKKDKDGKWMDDRRVVVQCPSCGVALSAGAATCPNTSRCGASITWKGEYPCGWCSASGKCPACYWNENGEKSPCHNCGGTGFKAYLGKSVACPNCKDSKVCPICAGSGQCDICKGAGKLSASDLGPRMQVTTTESPP